MKVYLSSTLDDLRDERQVVKDVFSGECIVKESYKASEQELVESCLADVAECELYVGIVGLRYGFRPPDGHGAASITQLEYEEAGRRNIPRLIFLKDPGVISVMQADGDWQSEVSAIAQFRKRVAAEQRPAQFSTPADLGIAVQKAYSDCKARREGAASLMASRQRHPWEYQYDIAFGCVPGTDDALREAFGEAAGDDRRMAVFPLSPADAAHYITQLDRHARTACAVVLPVSAASWPRLNEQRAAVSAAVRIVSERARVFALTTGIARADLDADFAAAFTDVFETPADAWGAAERGASLVQLRRWLRERLPGPRERVQVGIPILTLALTIDEAMTLQEDGTLFERFGDGAPLRRKAFGDLRQYLQDRGLRWPDDFYGPRREHWHPFGPQEKTVREFVAEAACKTNAAPQGSRERRRLRDQALVPLWYQFEEYLDDRAGSRDNLASVCETGCLVLLDEFALLHAGLRDAIERLVASDNAAVVVLSACDPAHSPLCKVLDDFSHFNLGNLRSRFRNAQDPCCELALNSITRLQRWLRLVLPELWATLGQQQSNPALLRRVDALFEP